MQSSLSYAYFALTGADFDPLEVTQHLGVQPTNSWRKGDPLKYNPRAKYANWELASRKATEHELVSNLDDVVAVLESKIQEIVDLKRRLQLNSVLQVVLFVDCNDEQSTPSFGHCQRTISFLYHTQTATDVDIYCYNSAEKS